MAGGTAGGVARLAAGVPLPVCRCAGSRRRGIPRRIESTCQSGGLVASAEWKKSISMVVVMMKILAPQ